MKALRYLLMTLLILGTIAAAVYVGLYVMLVGGIVEVVEAVKAVPVSSNGVAWGIVRIICACFVSVIIFYVGMFFVAMAHKFTGKSKTTKTTFRFGR